MRNGGSGGAPGRRKGRFRRHSATRWQSSAQTRQPKTASIRKLSDAGAPPRIVRARSVTRLKTGRTASNRMANAYRTHEREVMDHE